MRYEVSLEEKLTASAPRRGVVWAVALALLVNIFTIMPIMLRMAVADDTTMAAGCPMHDMGQKDKIGHYPVDHSHCLVCTGGIGTALLAADVAPVGPQLEATAPLRELPPATASRSLRTAYSTRAPPFLI